MENISEFNLNKLPKYCGDKVRELFTIVDDENQSPENIQINLMNFIQDIYWFGHHNGREQSKEQLKDHFQEIIENIIK